MTEPDHEIKGRILGVLEDRHLCDITQAAKMAGTTRITAKKHLERLAQENAVEEYRVGRSRIFLLRSGKT